MVPNKLALVDATTNNISNTSEKLRGLEQQTVDEHDLVS